jgi:AcrR family transcriptional regulator
MDTRPYHHGALRPALLEAAAQILERDGLDRLSLRAIARAAGVSHAAPAHHFGDLRGLLTALAVQGFQRFTALLEAAAIASPEPLNALGRAYVGFARAQPGLFALMFHNQVLDPEVADFQAATAAAAATLERVSAALPGPDGANPGARALRSWCLVHGFAMLLLDGRLPAAPGPDELLEALFSSNG